MDISQLLQSISKTERAWSLRRAATSIAEKRGMAKQTLATGASVARVVRARGVTQIRCLAGAAFNSQDDRGADASD